MKFISKATIAKLLVVCLIVSMMGTPVTAAVSTNGPNETSTLEVVYTINESAGLKSATVSVGSTAIESGVYVTSGDVVAVAVTVEDGYQAKVSCNGTDQTAATKDGNVSTYSITVTQRVEIVIDAVIPNLEKDANGAYKLTEDATVQDVGDLFADEATNVTVNAAGHKLTIETGSVTKPFTIDASEPGSAVVIGTESGAAVAVESNMSIRIGGIGENEVTLKNITTAEGVTLKVYFGEGENAKSLFELTGIAQVKSIEVKKAAAAALAMLAAVDDANVVLEDGELCYMTKQIPTGFVVVDGEGNVIEGVSDGEEDGYTVWSTDTTSEETTTYVLEAKSLDAFGEGAKGDGDTTPAGTDDYFTIIWSTKSKVDSSSKTFEDGYTSEQRINLGGTLSKSKNSIMFETAGKATVKVWWVSGGNGREIGILDSEGEEAAATSYNSESGTLYISTLELDEAGTYYLGGKGGNNYIFKIEVTAGTSSGGPSTDDDTYTLTVADYDTDRGEVEIVGVEPETDGTYKIEKDTEVTFKVTVYEGSKVGSITYKIGDDTQTLEAKDGEQSFKMEGDAMLTVLLVDETAVEYSVTVSQTPNGTTAVDKTKAYAKDTVTITATPDEGYEIDTVNIYKANGAEKGDDVTEDVDLTPTGDTTCTFTMPESDVIVEVTYKSTSQGPVISGDPHSITVAAATNGTVETDVEEATFGEPVTITTKPNSNYRVNTVEVTYKVGDDTVTWTKDDEIRTDKANTTYSFDMPDYDVTVTVTFTKKSSPTGGGGGSGGGGTATKPEDPGDGSTTPTTPTSPFRDVSVDAYYYDAVLWAIEKGITVGMTADTFGPDLSCTRAQMLTMLWRLAGSPEAERENPFTDVTADDYYYDAVLWAVDKGITVGTTADTFSPDATVNRAQSVTFLYRYAGQPTASGSSFSDVSADDYYANATAWAAQNGIALGYGNGNFGPSDDCVRAQIVTFMYRYAG